MFLQFFFKISTYLFHNDLQTSSSNTLISLIGTAVLRNVILNVGDNAKFVTFLLGTIFFTWHLSRVHVIQSEFRCASCMWGLQLPIRL